jgi:methyl-accepting chemotaxis protein
MQWTIGRRIVLGIGLGLVLVAIVATMSYVALQRSEATSEELVRTIRATTIMALNAQTERRTASLAHFEFLTGGGPQWLRRRDSTIALGHGIARRLASESTNPALAAAWRDADTALDRWHAIARTEDSLFAAGRDDARRRLRDSSSAIRLASRALMDKATQLSEAATDSAVATARRTLRWESTRLVLLAALALLICAVASFGVYRAIRNPLEETGLALASAGAQILAATAEQASGASETAAALAQTLATAEEVAKTSEQAAQRVRSVAESAERTAVAGATGRQAVEESVKRMTAVRQHVDSIAESILGLAEQSQAVADIIASVDSISEQTNLLSLNAAVEAARAGEHGRGFAVVATEIKSLAEQSKKATVQVRQIIGDIQRSTNQAVMTTEQGSKEVVAAVDQVTVSGRVIGDLVEAVAQNAVAGKQIMASAGQQAIGMAQIRDAMASVRVAVDQTATTTRETERTATDLNRLGARLLAMIRGDDAPRARRQT